MIHHLIDFLNPARGSLVTFISLIAGILPNYTQETQTLILFFFQIMAFSVSIMVGILTTFHIYCKLIDRRNNRKKKNNET